MNYPHPILAKEGWPFIAASFVLAVLASSAGFWALPFWAVFLFCVQFFRDPAREIAGGPKSVLAPADGRIVVVPNGKIIAGNIINFSREPARRNEFIIGVSYDADIDKVKQLLTSIIESDDRILRDREMTVRLNELGASSVNFVVRVWSKSSDLQNVYWDVLERIKREFDAAGISFPYPQMDVNFKRVKEDKAA